MIPPTPTMRADGLLRLPPPLCLLFWAFALTTTIALLEMRRWSFVPTTTTAPSPVWVSKPIHEGGNGSLCPSLKVSAFNLWCILLLLSMDHAVEPGDNSVTNLRTSADAHFQALPPFITTPQPPILTTRNFLVVFFFCIFTSDWQRNSSRVVIFIHDGCVLISWHVVFCSVYCIVNYAWLIM